MLANLDRFSSQDEELLGSLGQETRELVHKNVLNLVRLLDFDTDADTVDTGLDEDPFRLIARDCERVQKKFW